MPFHGNHISLITMQMKLKLVTSDFVNLFCFGDTCEMQLPKAVIQNQEVNGKTNIAIGLPHEMLQAMVVEGVERPNSQQ